MLYSIYMRKLNDIIPPSRRREIQPMNNASKGEFSHDEDSQQKFPHKTLIIAVAVIIISIGALFYFSIAKIEVIPNTVTAEVKGSFTAGDNTGALPYKIITAQKIASQAVRGSGTKTVNSFASGIITIYNTQSKSQKLITNTRFATAAGLIFRIHSPVTIPSGTTAKPGSVTARVYADKAGDSYNVGPADLTVPGFAGTPLASRVYALSTVAMKGGASGTVPVVEASSESQARIAIIKALDPDLTTSVEELVPEGYVLLQGATTTVHEELASVPSATSGMVDVKEQGTITAVVFPNEALARAIAISNTALGYQNEPVTLTSTKELSLTTNDGLPSAEGITFTFTLSGAASILYTVDPTRISAAVSGKTRSESDVALKNYPEVKRAIIILRPFWRQTFPQDPSSISVVVTKP